MIDRTYIKKYPAEYHSQSAIDAAMEIIEQHGGTFESDEIESIEIATFTASWEIIAKDPEKNRPKSRETADHSIQYITCAALVDGHVWHDTFEESRFTDEELLSVVAKTKVIADQEFDKLYPQDGIPNRITVRTKDGKTYESTVSAPSGHALNPMTDEEVVAKYRRMADPMLRKLQVEEVIERTLSLENEHDITGLLTTLVV
jgi:2-methylcitrate dehydratase